MNTLNYKFKPGDRVCHKIKPDFELYVEYVSDSRLGEEFLHVDVVFYSSSLGLVKQSYPINDLDFYIKSEKKTNSPCDLMDDVCIGE